MEEVQFPSTLRAVGYRAFMGCVGLYAVSLPDGLKELGPSCFQGSGIREIIIPTGVRRVSERAFADCKNLNRVTFASDGVLREIGAEAFRATLLKSIETPDSLRCIGAQAFRDCKELREVVLNEHLKILGKQCFQAAGLAEIKIPRCVTTIQDGAFSTC